MKISDVSSAPFFENEIKFTKKHPENYPDNEFNHPSDFNNLRKKRSPAPGLSHIIKFTFNDGDSVNINSTHPRSNSTEDVNFIFRFFRTISENKWKELHAPVVMLKNIRRSGNLLQDIKKSIGGELHFNTSVTFKLSRREIFHGCVKFLDEQEKTFIKKRNITDAFYKKYSYIKRDETNVIKNIYYGDYLKKTSMLNVRSFTQLPDPIKKSFDSISDNILLHGKFSTATPGNTTTILHHEKKSMLSVMLNHIAYQIKLSRDKIHSTRSLIEVQQEQVKIDHLIGYQLEVMTELYVSHIEERKKINKPDALYLMDKLAVTHYIGLIGQIEKFRNEIIKGIIDVIFSDKTNYLSSLSKIQKFNQRESWQKTFLGDGFIHALSYILEVDALHGYSNQVNIKMINKSTLKKIRNINDENYNRTSHYDGEIYKKIKKWSQENKITKEMNNIQQHLTFVDIKNSSPEIFNWKIKFSNYLNEMISLAEKEKNKSYFDDTNKKLNSESLIYIIINKRMTRSEMFIKRLFPFSDYAEIKWENANNFSDAKKSIRITFAEAVAFYRKWNPTDSDMNALILDKDIRELIEEISIKTSNWEQNLIAQVDNLKYDASYLIGSYGRLNKRIDELKNISNIDHYTKTYNIHISQSEKQKLSDFFNGRSQGYLVGINDNPVGEHVPHSIICIPLRKGNGSHDGFESLLVSLEQQEIVRLPALLGPERKYISTKSHISIDDNVRKDYLDSLESRKAMHEKGYRDISREVENLRNFLQEELSPRYIPDKNSDYLTHVKMTFIDVDGPAGPATKIYRLYESDALKFTNFSLSTHPDKHKLKIINNIIENKNTRLKDEIDDFIFTADDKWFSWDEREIRNTKEWMDVFIILFSIGSVLFPTPNLSMGSKFFLKYLPFTLVDLLANVNSALLGKSLASNYDELKNSNDDLYKSIFYWGAATFSSAAISIATPLPKHTYTSNRKAFIRSLHQDIIADARFAVSQDMDYLVARLYGDISYARSLKSLSKNAPADIKSLLNDMVEYSFLQTHELIDDDIRITQTLKNNIFSSEIAINQKLSLIENKINNLLTPLQSIATDINLLNDELVRMYEYANEAKKRFTATEDRFLQLSDLISLMPGVRKRVVETRDVLSSTIQQFHAISANPSIDNIKRMLHCSDSAAKSIAEYMPTINNGHRTINVGDLYAVSNIIGGGSAQGDSLLHILREITSISIKSMIDKTPEMLIIDAVTGYIDLYQMLFKKSNLTSTHATPSLNATMIAGNTSQQESLFSALGFWHP
ncbi:hypothetical protein [Candidatus Pantoea multigeneris]|uniref:Uncharacterized protein n=1 Tax=Candidatus Pantoea multigeneris TaxID=2608357 RepID=A0ABX0RBX0_9GAMM|nr:hypothetical protein [Pantoea multigeneris]NIF22830.1 hypothetical protein [Pantoea multigeneris]